MEKDDPTTLLPRKNTANEQESLQKENPQETEKEQQRKEQEHRERSETSDFFESSQQIENEMELENIPYTQINPEIENAYLTQEEQTNNRETETEEHAPRNENREENTINKNKKRTKKKYVDKTYEYFNKMFSGSDSWSPFLNIKTETKISTLDLELALMKTYATKEMKLKRISDLEWTVETTTKAQSERYMQITSLCNNKVQVKPHDTLNYRYGTMVIPKTEELNLEEDKPKLLGVLQERDPNIKDIELYEIKVKATINRQSKKLQIAKLKYKTTKEVPNRIVCFGEVREIRTFVPKPMQCKKCFAYGHTKKKCKQLERCVTCGSREHESSFFCNHETKCTNCQGDHHALAKSCPYFEYNSGLQYLIATKGYNIHQAKVEMRLNGHENPAIRRTFAMTATEETRTAGDPERGNSNKDECSNKNVSGKEIQTQNRYASLNKEEEEHTSEEDNTIDFEDWEESPQEKKRKEQKKPKEPELEPLPQREELPITEEATGAVKRRKIAQQIQDTMIRKQQAKKEEKDKSDGRREEKQANPHKHDMYCGCHYCLHNTITQVKDTSVTNIIRTMKNFCKIKTTNTKHFDPIELCRCKECLQKKMTDTAWTEKVAENLLIKYNKKQPENITLEDAQTRRRE